MSGCKCVVMTSLCLCEWVGCACVFEFICECMPGCVWVYTRVYACKYEGVLCVRGEVGMREYVCVRV